VAAGYMQTVCNIFIQHAASLVSDS